MRPKGLNAPTVQSTEVLANFMLLFHREFGLVFNKRFIYVVVSFIYSSSLSSREVLPSLIAWLTLRRLRA